MTTDQLCHPSGTEGRPMSSATQDGRPTPEYPLAKRLSGRPSRRRRHARGHRPQEGGTSNSGDPDVTGLEGLGGLERDASSSRPPDNQRLIASVVIPSIGRTDSLSRCLASIARQTVDRDAFEVIVVDDCSGSEYTWLPESVVLVKLPAWKGPAGRATPVLPSRRLK